MQSYNNDMIHVHHLFRVSANNTYKHVYYSGRFSHDGLCWYIYLHEAWAIGVYSSVSIVVC